MINKEKFNKITKKYNLNIKINHIIVQSLTHSSYANEHKTEHNERLEFLGDSILSLFVTRYIFEKYPAMQEGEMTKLRATYVCEDANARYAKKLGLDELILLGHGEELGGGRNRDAVLNDAFEAFLAGVYLTSGLEEVKKIIDQVVYPLIGDYVHVPFVDYKSRLQEYIQAESRSILVYRLDNQDGPPHKRVFTISAILDGIKLGTGVAGSKKEAEQLAAQEALKKLVQ